MLAPFRNILALHSNKQISELPWQPFIPYLYENRLLPFSRKTLQFNIYFDICNPHSNALSNHILIYTKVNIIGIHIQSVFTVCAQCCCHWWEHIIAAENCLWLMLHIMNKAINVCQKQIIEMPVDDMRHNYYCITIKTATHWRKLWQYKRALIEIYYFFSNETAQLLKYLCVHTAILPSVKYRICFWIITYLLASLYAIRLFSTISDALFAKTNELIQLQFTC